VCDVQTLADVFAVGQAMSGPDGRVWTLRPPTLYEQGQFQRFLESRAHLAIDRSEASEDAKDRRHAIIDKDAALGKFEWDGAVALEAMFTPVGLAQITFLVCRDQGMTESQAEELLRHNIRQVASKILQLSPDEKKALAPVLRALGLPNEWFDADSNDSSSSNCSTPPSTEASPNSPDAPITNCCSSTRSSEAPMG